ncbi:MFS transporter [Gordonia hydrophobica]|uniref:MFS transporter n=1 Tax=Gordonia hydrophobica TaxID=40516 RepID=A0ABZ2U6Q9_9ACTN|nr:MFS transporter [Gordonia hydrophobica]MBM7365401.1 MFS family permease [Gordonia hydrophobica]
MTLSQSQAGDPESQSHGATQVTVMSKRAVVSGTLGSALEYFDFTVYGLLAATLFPKLFFHDLGPSAGLLASFATFGAGFLARPLGAIVFGHLGDKYGRRPVLHLTLLLMGVSSVVIGLLPTGQGIVIASILVGLRFLQGFSLGGEATGSQLMVMEHAPSNRRGFFGSIPSSGSPISQVCANLLLVLLTSVLTEQQWESWGWRLPFLMSIAIVAVAAVVRMKLDETPVFTVVKDDVQQAGAIERDSGLGVVAAFPKTVFLLTLAWGGVLSTFYLVTVYGLSLMKSEGGMQSNTAFLILVVGSALAVPACLFGGWISDRVGRRKTILTALAGCAIGMGAFFSFMHFGSVPLVGLAVIIAMCSTQLAGGPYAAFYAEQFPTKYRFSGSAISITFSNLVFSAPAPFVATALADSFGIYAVMALTLVIIALSAFVITRLREGGGIDLEEIGDTAAGSVDQAESGAVQSPTTSDFEEMDRTIPAQSRPEQKLLTD